MRFATTVVLFLLSCAVLGVAFRWLGVPFHLLATVLGACVVTGVLRSWLLAKVAAWKANAAATRGSGTGG